MGTRLALYNILITKFKKLKMNGSSEGVSMFKIIIATAMFAGMYALAADTNSPQSKTLPSLTKVTTQEGKKPDMGVMLGVASPEGSYKSGLEYGLTASFQPIVPLGLGGEITRNRTTVKDSGDALDRTNIWINTTYNFGGENIFLKYSYVGVGVGAILESDGTNLASAPLVGFDVPLAKENDAFSLGARAKYAVISGRDPDTLSVDAVFKYWY